MQSCLNRTDAVGAPKKMKARNETEPLMQKKTLIPILVALSLAWSLPPASAGDTRKEPKTVSAEVSNALLGLSVRAKLVEKLGADALAIDVTVSGDKAFLSGEVPKKATQELAREVALSVKGIKSVSDKVTEKSPAKPLANAEAEVMDAALEIKVKSLLLEEIGSNALSINVESTDGVVSLRGKLDSAAISKAASDKVRSIKGVKKVVNLLSV